MPRHSLRVNAHVHAVALERRTAEARRLERAALVEHAIIVEHAGAVADEFDGRAWSLAEVLAHVVEHHAAVASPGDPRGYDGLALILWQGGRPVAIVEAGPSGRAVVRRLGRPARKARPGATAPQASLF